MESPGKEASSKQQFTDVQSSTSCPKLSQVESQLESLGFVISNGEAKLKVDENVAGNLITNENLDFSLMNEDEEEDTLSFVVLGKSSLDSIHASSLVSYADIQQKSMSADYNSIVSSMNSEDVYKKVTELLQENTKLKETLKQNNSSMKERIKTLAVWQEEMMKVHNNHKRKFAETTELIKYLKRENNELKMKVAMKRSADEESQYSMADITKSNESEKRNTSPSELVEKVSSLRNIPSTSRQNPETMSSFNTDKLLSMLDALKFEENKEAICTIQEPKSKLDTLQTVCKQSSNIEKSSISCENCHKRGEEITTLKECISLLEAIVRLLGEKLNQVSTPIKVCVKDVKDVKEYHIQRTKNMREHIERLQEVTAFFDTQIKHANNTVTYMKEVLHTVEVILNQLSTRCQKCDYCYTLDVTVLEACKDKLCVCYQKICTEKQELIEKQQNATESQKQFKKILLGYESTLHELEVMLKGNEKVTTSQDSVTQETMKGVSNSEHEKKTNGSNSLVEQNESLSRESECLAEKMRLIKKQEEDLKAQYKLLNEERELFVQEKLSLKEEKTALDQQSRLYEDVGKSLQIEKKTAEIKCSVLNDEVDALKSQMNTKEQEITKLQEQLKQQEETISMMQMQMKMYEEDYWHERKVRESLLKDQNDIVSDMQQQIEMSKTLQDEITRLKSKGNNSSMQTTETSFSCPMCLEKFTSAEAIQTHVESCTQLSFT